MSTATLTQPTKNQETGKWEVEDGEGNVYEFDSRKAAREWDGPGSEGTPSSEDEGEEVLEVGSIESRIINSVSSANRFLKSKIKNLMSDLSKNEVEVLNLIEDTPVPQSALAERLGVTSTVVGQSIKKLEEAELVLSVRSKTDRRSFDIVLTKEGQNKKSEVVNKRDEALGDLFGEFEESELATLEELLSRFK